MNIMKWYIIVSIIVLLAAGAIYLQLSGKAEEMPFLKLNSTGTSGLELNPQGAAPEFTGIEHWLNSDPLTLQQLRGKVVLVDFWTYSCINCIRTLPYVTRWYDTYHDRGLVVVGVHTPEFEFEKLTKNVEQAIKQYGIHYPVAQDNQYHTWVAYHNQYWPAEYLIDQQGQIVYTHFGEGNYDRTEQAIRTLLGITGGAPQTTSPTAGVGVKTPETYFGLRRLEFFSSPQSPVRETKAYSFPQQLPPNQFALSGKWQFGEEYAEAVEAGAKLESDFTAGKLYMVAESSTGKPVRVKLKVDGKETGEVSVQASQLYTLFEGSTAAQHRLELEILEPGLRLFTFTFG